jgi:hypothetical protein
LHACGGHLFEGALDAGQYALLLAFTKVRNTLAQGVCANLVCCSSALVPSSCRATLCALGCAPLGYVQGVMAVSSLHAGLILTSGAATAAAGPFC